MIEETTEEIEQPVEKETDFLRLASDAYEQSSSFLEMAMFNRWSKNYSLAQSEHPQGSKYHTEAYKRRSRNFRGKTEASIRKNEAAMAVAMFSHEDVTSISAINRDVEEHEEAAKNLHILVNERLENSIKWFMIAIGGYHEAMITGNVVSEQYWDYDRTSDGTVRVDKPTIELYPPENVKISPYAHWLDPINSSPYVVVEIPMFIGDIKARMKIDWHEADDTAILAASEAFELNQVKQSREGAEQNAGKETSRATYTDFDICYVHKNFIREDGVDYFYFTLGTQALLSDPVEVREAYPHLGYGERPLVWGTATIEPHKVYSRSLVDRVEGGQILINDLANLRMDNVRQVLNKRKYATRNSGIDYSALMQSFPGGVVLMDDINSVKPEDTPDVTGSSYNEQNLLNVDFDELAGSFSTGSVASNRALNETVGGMSMLQGNSNTLTEYQLRVLVETWVENVIRQIVQMVKFYEDDETIASVCGPEVTSETIQVPVKTRVSVGFGSTDPQQKVQKLLFGLGAIAQVAPEEIKKIKAVKLMQEIFGYLGFNDGKAFVDDSEEVDPQVQELTMQVQQLQQIVQQKQIEAQQALALEDKRGRNSVIEAMLKVTADRQVQLTKLAVERDLTVAELEHKAGADSGKMNLELLKELNRQMDIKNKKNELTFKMSSGRDGI